ncbi:alcohol dehydrogenase GroES domain protein [Crassisporium funariophilum]|nr:alcohol dehydrogenase GroES domain protein [Crassisporium funariophilum]
MKAARYYGPGDVRVEQIEEPEAKEGQLKVKVFCGSDLHAYLMPVPKFPTTTEANELTGETLPVTLGHEFSGTIVSLGPGVDGNNWKIGQNVTIEPVISCLKTHSCTYCASGARNLCRSSNFILTQSLNIRELADGVAASPIEIGAVIEPLAVAYYAVKRSGFKPGQTALVVGAGPQLLEFMISNLSIFRSIDPSTTILISEPALIRRTLALKHGATHALDPLSLSASGSPSVSAIPNAVLQATHGIGVDVAFDAAGIQASIDAALMSLRPRGIFVNVAIWEADPRISMNLILLKEITVTGTIAYSQIHPELLEAVAAGKFQDVEELITSRIAIEDVVEQGFMALLNDKAKQVKILVHP